jgi:hypothetical protein
LDLPAHQAAHQALQALLVRLVQLGPLVLAQAVQQAPLAFKGLLGSQEHLAQPAHKEQRELLEPLELLARLALRAQMGLQAQLAFKAQQAQEQQARVSRALPAQPAWAQLEFKDQLERPACPAQLELQAQPGPLE